MQTLDWQIFRRNGILGILWWITLDFIPRRLRRLADPYSGSAAAAKANACASCPREKQMLCIDIFRWQSNTGCQCWYCSVDSMARHEDLLHNVVCPPFYCIDMSLSKGLAGMRPHLHAKSKFFWLHGISFSTSIKLFLPLLCYSYSTFKTFMQQGADNKILSAPQHMWVATEAGQYQFIFLNVKACSLTVYWNIHCTLHWQFQQPVMMEPSFNFISTLPVADKALYPKIW